MRGQPSLRINLFTSNADRYFCMANLIGWFVFLLCMVMCKVEMMQCSNRGNYEGSGSRRIIAQRILRRSAHKNGHISDAYLICCCMNIEHRQVSTPASWNGTNADRYTSRIQPTNENNDLLKLTTSLKVDFWPLNGLLAVKTCLVLL